MCGIIMVVVTMMPLSLARRYKAVRILFLLSSSLRKCGYTSDNASRHEAAADDAPDHTPTL
jgi:hypothetical protein